jgi:hypothetical protein
MSYTVLVNWSCGRCPSGTYSADMTRNELIRHMAATHNAVVYVKKLGPLAVRIPGK